MINPVKGCSGEKDDIRSNLHKKLYQILDISSAGQPGKMGWSAHGLQVHRFLKWIYLELHGRSQHKAGKKPCCVSKIRFSITGGLAITTPF